MPPTTRGPAPPKRGLCFCPGFLSESRQATVRAMASLLLTRKQRDSHSTSPGHLRPLRNSAFQPCIPPRGDSPAPRDQAHESRAARLLTCLPRLGPVANGRPSLAPPLSDSARALAMPVLTRSADHAAWHHSLSSTKSMPITRRIRWGFRKWQAIPCSPRIPLIYINRPR